MTIIPPETDPLSIMNLILHTRLDPLQTHVVFKVNVIAVVNLVIELKIVDVQNAITKLISPKDFEMMTEQLLLKNTTTF
jgi:hypothetical protein